MSDLPTGTVTFLFTDLEFSTRLWEENADAMRVALEGHDQILRDAIETHDGQVKTTGDGFHAAAWMPRRAASRIATEEDCFRRHRDTSTSIEPRMSELGAKIP